MHPHNYDLDSMNPHRSYSVCAWSLEKNSRPGAESLSSVPLLSSPKCEGVTRAGNPRAPITHNTHALAIRNSKKRICIVYIRIFLAIHIKFTANFFFHWVPNLDSHKELSTTKCRYQFTLNTKI